METSMEIMETQETMSSSKSEAKPSPKLESRKKESHSGSQSPLQTGSSSQVKQAAQEIPSQTVPSSHVKSSTQALASPLPGTSSETSFSSASSDTANGPAQKKQRLDYKSMSSGVYLDSTVVPILHVALVTLDRLRPDDPVQFVIDYLLRHKAQYSKNIPSGTSANQA